ncbi:hypothetical protein GN956_G13640 [Arapaima gigas]
MRRRSDTARFVMMTVLGDWSPCLQRRTHSESTFSGRPTNSPKEEGKKRMDRAGGRSGCDNTHSGAQTEPRLGGGRTFCISCHIRGQ